MAKSTVVVKFLADVDGMKRGIDQVNGQLGTFTKLTKGIGAGLAGAFAVENIAQFVGQAIQAGSALQEVESKVRQLVGGGNAGMLDSWAESAATSMGLSKTAALDASSTFITLAQAAGQSEGAATQFAQQFTQLAADLASFNNTSVDDAVRALGAGLRGEAEPLRRYGVLLDDASLKAAYFEQTGQKVTGTLTSQQRVLAAQAAIWKQTAKAQGDYARTADGLANTQRTIAAAFENATTSIGTGFLVAIDKVNKALGGPNSIADGIEGIGTYIGDTVGGLGVLTAAVVDLTQAISENVTGAEQSNLTWEDGVRIALESLPVLGAQIKAYNYLGEEQRKAAEAAQAQADGQAALYAGYAENSRIAKENAGIKAQEAKAAETLKEAQQALNAVFEEQNTILSKLRSRIDLAAWYDDLAENIDKASRSLNINTEKGRTNAEVILDGIGILQQQAEAFVNAGGSADKAAEKYDAGVRKMRKALIEQGFKPADIDKFLASAGWQPAIDKLERQATEAAAKAGAAIGRGLGDGMLEGMSSRERAIAAQGARMTALAEAAARQESQTRSPSKKWEALGLDLGAGLKRGIEIGFAGIETMIVSEFQGFSAITSSASVMVPKALVDAFNERFGAFKDAVQAYEDALRQRQAAIASIAEGIKSTVLGALNFQQTKTIQVLEGDKLVDKIVPLTSEEMANALFGDIQKQQDVVNIVAQNIGTKLPTELLTKILSLPPDTAYALADYLGKNPEMVTKLQENWDALAKSTETLLGVPMGETWAKIGNQSADEFVNAALEKLDEEKKRLNKWSRNNHVQLFVDVVYNDPRSSGASLAGAGRAGSPQQIVSALRDYERVNGTAWRV